MRVGVNALFLIPGEVGGSEVYVRNVLPLLTSVDADIDLAVFTNRENHETFAEFERIPLGVCARSRPRRIIAEQIMLGRAVRRARLDLLFSPGYTAPLRVPNPQVVAILDVQFLDFPGDFTWAGRLVHRFLVGRAARAASAVATLSDFSKRQIHTHLDVPQEKIVVSHLAASQAFSEPQACPYNKPFLLYVSNTYPHKNAQRLARAFLSVAERIPHDLVLVGQPRGGEPPPHPRIRRIHRLEHPGAELVGLFQGCDLFVFPSLYEGFGLPVIEAMAAGARVVAARAGSIPEVAGDAATYFDGTDEADIARTITEALNEPSDTRRNFVEAGRSRAAQFTWEACARRTVAAFHLALDRSQRPHE